MNFITQSNSQSRSVLFENGKALCSYLNPEKEALAWVARQEIQKMTDVLILGLGAGYHVEQLLRQAPHLSISVVDFRPECFRFFEEEFPYSSNKVKCFYLRDGAHLDQRIFNFVSDIQPLVLPFRPAWQNHEHQFADLYTQMTFRSLEVLEKVFHQQISSQEMDLSKLASQKELLHLKNIFESTKEVESHLSLKLSVLRELWI